MNWFDLMRRGDFASAWKLSDQALLSRRGIPCAHWPRHLQYIWDGTPLHGKRVLVRCYHGLGDTVQFIRYAPLLKNIAREVIVWAQPSLLELLATVEGIDRLLPLHDGVPDVDYQVDVELMELPHIFRSTLETIPRRVPYIYSDRIERVRLLDPEDLVAKRVSVSDPTDRVANILRASRPPVFPVERPNVSEDSLAKRVSVSDQAYRHCSAARCSPRLRVGLVWRSGDWDHRRSIPAHLLWPLAELNHVDLYLLQHGSAQKEWGSAGGIFIGDHSISAAARLTRAMDLVITVDTLTAHLAAAQAVPVWTLLPAAADWRWLTDREDSPWYPTMRLFRQSTPGDWRSVVDRVVAELKT